MQSKKQYFKSHYQPEYARKMQGVKLVNPSTTKLKSPRQLLCDL